MPQATLAGVAGPKVATVFQAASLAQARRDVAVDYLQRLRDGVDAAVPMVLLGDLLHAAAGTIKRRSLVLVVSDFISQPGWDDALARLALRHDVVAVRLFDPLEMALPELGLVTVEDAETGEQLFIDSADPGFRRRYAAEAQAREAALRESLAHAGADTLELSTEDDLLEAMLRFAALRRQRARLKVGARWPAQLRQPAGANAGVAP